MPRQKKCNYIINGQMILTPGPNPSILLQFRLLPDDLLLLTSDGIPNALGNQPEHAILKLLQETLGDGPRDEAALQRAARRLVDEANHHGGKDNLTAVLVSIAAPTPGEESKQP